MKPLLDDKEIIDLFNQGGNGIDAAFRAIVVKYSERLYSQIRRITRNHEHTNDVLQNVLIKVYQSLDSFNQNSTLYTWMYRIARNETLNFIDKEKRRSGVDLDESIMEIVAGHHVLDSTTPEIISSLLEDAIGSLPEKQAMVFQLKYFEDPIHPGIKCRILIKAIETLVHLNEYILEHIISVLMISGDPSYLTV